MLKRMHGQLTRGEFETIIATYLDNELPAGKNAVFKWQMRICSKCCEYLGAHQRSIELEREVLKSPEDPVPADVLEKLIGAILDDRSRCSREQAPSRALREVSIP